MTPADADRCKRPPPLPTVMDLLLDAVCVVDRDGRYRT
jgi:hypothetical protein